MAHDLEFSDKPPAVKPRYAVTFTYYMYVRPQARMQVSIYAQAWLMLPSERSLNKFPYLIYRAWKKSFILSEIKFHIPATRARWSAPWWRKLPPSLGLCACIEITCKCRWYYFRWESEILRLSVGEFKFAVWCDFQTAWWPTSLSDNYLVGAVWLFDGRQVIASQVVTL